MKIPDPLPESPPDSMIESMCVRYDHAFLMPAQEMLGRIFGWSEEQRDACRADMRRLAETVWRLGDVARLRRLPRDLPQAWIPVMQQCVPAMDPVSMKQVYEEMSGFGFWSVDWKM